jgi:hypothetical protein
MKAFQVYHLNLAFSSIPTQARGDVIKQCYWPLLRMAKDLHIPVGIELTGWTLQQILQIAPDWVSQFKSMLQSQQCELIGSGWTQLIGPLVPAEVNEWNQKLGLEAYESILGIRPNLVLVNEMAYSTSLVNLYSQAGYSGMIMDRDNVRLALDLDHHPASIAPTHALGHDGLSFPVLWSDSILFQRLQRVVHGDIPVSEYLDYLRQRADGSIPILPIYCNDAEIFDYRPGRFSNEAKLHPEGEWVRMQRVLTQLRQQIGVQWVAPSLALTIQNEGRSILAKTLSSAAHPIPVKKQAKYNINRWAVTGRDDLWLNTTCHRLCQQLLLLEDHSPSSWRELCEFWASDLRTHITTDRWSEMLARLSRFENSLPMVAPVAPQPAPAATASKVEINQGEEGILWNIETGSIQLVLNARRGLTLKSLAFKSQAFAPIIGTLPQGYFESIELGADYYSGGVLIEIPEGRLRFTDLEWVTPEILQTDTKVIIKASLNLGSGRLIKIITLNRQKEEILMSYEFVDWERPIGIVRVGILTLLPDAVNLPLTLHCQNGGHKPEQFVIESPFSHIHPASAFVSSTSAIGATNGKMSIVDAKGLGFQVTWNPASCAAVPMMKHLTTTTSHLTRLSFSLCELDDTTRAGGRLLPFELLLTPLIS